MAKPGPYDLTPEMKRFVKPNFRRPGAASNYDRASMRSVTAGHRGNPAWHDRRSDEELAQALRDKRPGYFVQVFPNHRFLAIGPRSFERG
jgi:hypothetical protein